MTSNPPESDPSTMTSTISDSRERAASHCTRAGSSKWLHMLWGLSLLALLPLLTMQVGHYWRLIQLWFVPLMVAVILFYCWRVPKVGLAVAPVRRIAGMTLMLGGIALGLLASFLILPAWALFSGSIICTGWLLLWLGIVPWTRVLALCSLLLLASQPWPMLDGWLTSLNRQSAIAAMGACLDQFGVFYFQEGALLELTEERLRLDGLFTKFNNFMPLLLVTCFGLVWFRSQLFPAVLTLATLPLIVWAIETVYLLLVVWQVEMGESEWLTGGLLFAQTSTLALVEIGCVVMANRGWVRVCEPLPLSPSESSQRFSPQAIYNRVVLWPLRIAVASGDEPHFDLDAEEHLQMTTRALPDARATAQASDPFQRTRWGWVMLALQASALGCGIAAVMIEGISRGAAPVLSATAESLERLEATLPSGELDDGMRLSAFTRQDDEDGRGVSYGWTIEHRERSGRLWLRYAAEPYQMLSRRLRASGWELSEPGRLIEVSVNDTTWPVHEMRLREASGRQAQAWSTGADASGEPTAQARSIAGWLKDALAESIVGRLVYEPAADEVLQTQLLIETSSEPLASDQRRAFAQMLVRIVLEARDALER